MPKINEINGKKTNLIITKIKIKVHPSITLKEVPFALLATFVLFIITNESLVDGSKSFQITRADGVLMVLFLPFQ